VKSVMDVVASHTQQQQRDAQAQMVAQMRNANAQKRNSQVDGSRGDGVQRRPRELVIYGEKDPSAPGFRDPKDPVWNFPHHHVLHLGRHTFKQTVLPALGNTVEHWIVLFCYNWWEPCQHIADPYSAFAGEWEGKLNQDLFTKHVRFAKVDCATDKELCNAQDVEGYPHIKHYVKGSVIAKWTGGRETDSLRLAKWLGKQFTKSDQAPSEGGEVNQGELPINLDIVSERCMNLMLILGVIALNVHAICQNAGLWKNTAAGQAQARVVEQVHEAPAVALHHNSPVE